MKQKSKMIFLIGTLLLILSACSEPAINSKWQNSEIKIDGNHNDWVGSLNYYEDEKVAIGVSNNNDFINFCLTTSDNEKIMRILRSGFTVWLDPESSDGETIGIQYPIKRFANPMMDRTRKELKDHDNGDDIIKNIINKFKIEQNEILILNKNKFPLNAYPLENEIGIEVKVDYIMHQFIYELKVPLANTNQSIVYIDALPNEIIKVGFESGEIDEPDNKAQNNMRGSKGEGMSAGGRGGKRGGGRSGEMRNVKKMMDPIEFWMEVKLAEKN